MEIQMENRYNGWANWETWSTNLWIANDEQTYNIAMSFANSKDLEVWATRSRVNKEYSFEDSDYKKVDFEEIYQGLHE